MKRLVIWLLTAFMLLVLIGCHSTSPADPAVTPPSEQSQDIPDYNEEPEIAENNDPVISLESLGGVRLGMTGAQVESILGKNYTDEIWHEGGYFGESLIYRQYPDCNMVIGQESNVVKQIDVCSDAYPTDLGFKVGDPSIQVMDAYREKYEEFVGRHSSDKLLGWFLTDGTDELLIFSSMENRERFNEFIEEDSKITAITLGRARYFD